MAFTVFRRFFGGAVNTASGYAIGGAMQPALDPLTQDLANRTWALHPDRPVDPALLANAVAQGQIDRQVAKDEAALTGISGDRFDQLVQVFDTGPGVAYAFELWRRGEINEAGFRRAVKREGIEDEWIDDLVRIKVERLNPAVIALAIVRGIMKDPGFLPVAPPEAEGKVPAFPVSPIDPLTEAEASGWDEARLFVQTAIDGRPMSPEAAAASVFRGILERVDFDRAIAEGDVRNEWAAAIFEHARQIPSVADYVNANIRGWITTAEMHAGVARHGMSAADADLLYLRTGRPATTHQVHIGFQRGGRNAQIGDDERATFTKAVVESDIRPEWEPLLWAQRYTYPPFFAIRTLLQSQTLTAAEGEQILLYSGWEPTLAKTVAEHFAQPTGTAAVDPYVGKADTQLWNALHKAYVKTGVERATVEPVLTKLVKSQADRDEIFSDWDDEKAINAAPAPPA